MKRIGQNRKKTPQKNLQLRLPFILAAERQSTEEPTTNLQIKSVDFLMICKGQDLTVVIIHKVTKDNHSPIRQHIPSTWETIVINFAIALLMFILSLLVKLWVE